MKQVSKLVVALIVIAGLAACGQKPAEQVATDAKSKATAATEAAVEKANLTKLLAQADLKQGERSFLQCRACHSLEEGGINKVGPNLFGVFDRPAGQADGFNYSDALMAAGVSWDVETMDAWIKRPSVVIPGNRMVFVGIRDAQQRANLIAYLQEQTIK